jgi:multicomponent Na+:H+ antiporter subunit D
LNHFKLLIISMIILPLLSAAILLLIPARRRQFAARIMVLAIVFSAFLLPIMLWERGISIELGVGGWKPPLGIFLELDGLAAVFIVFLAILYASIACHPSGSSRGDPLFWPLMMLQWAGLNGLFLVRDFFSVYVTLELVTLSSVGLIMRAGKRFALAAALRYLLLALGGSLTYLMGVAMIYGATGILYMTTALASLPEEVITFIAIGLIFAGLLFKSALFPLHSWLPPAHGGAPSPVSAVLSAAVVAGAWLVLFRLWYLLPVKLVWSYLLGTTLGCLGCIAILWGGILALRQESIKAIIAYSTVSQIGYFFLFFTFVAGDSALETRHLAWGGTVALVIAHGFAKASAFLTAGVLMTKTGGGNLEDLRGGGLRYPALALAFAIAGVNLMGLPPTAGFSGKWMLLKSAILSGNFHVAAVILIGGLLAAAYVFRVLEVLLVQKSSKMRQEGGLKESVVPLLLAGLTVVLALSMSPLLEFLDIGAPIEATPTATGAILP